MTTGWKRFLEGVGQWERTEGRAEAGGSNSNHTDQACSSWCGRHMVSGKLRDSPLRKWPRSRPCSPLPLPSGQGLSLQNPCSRLWWRWRAGRGNVFWLFPHSPSPSSFDQFGNPRVAVLKFPIRFEFYDVAHTLPYVLSYLNTSLDGLANTNYPHPTSSPASCRCTRRYRGDT
jgi:hypothetical protein